MDFELKKLKWQIFKMAETGDIAGIKTAMAEREDTRLYLEDALQIASRHNQFELVKYLHIDLDVDIHSAEDYALHEALDNGHVEIAKYLHAHGAVANPDDDLYYWSKEYGFEDVIDFLKSINYPDVFNRLKAFT